MNRRLVAALACRNQGTRLYGKPVQNLDVETGVRIIDHLIACLQHLGVIDEIVLGIAEGHENEIFREIAVEKGIKFVIGDQDDVLGRLIACADLVGATDVFRVTPESPYLYFEPVKDAWERYKTADADALFYDELIDGCGFEIISRSALDEAHQQGGKAHLEHCTLYLRENNSKFKIIRLSGPQELQRRDLRLTVDNPEDLALCRTVYGMFKDQAPTIRVHDIVAFLDANPSLIQLTAPFAEQGYKTMYVWGKE